MNMNEILQLKMKILRKLSGASMTEFAEELEISRTSLQNIEIGKANPTLETIQQIAKKLEIPPMSLISDDYDVNQLYTAKSFLSSLHSFLQLSPEDQQEAMKLFERLVKILSTR